MHGMLPAAVDVAERQERGRSATRVVVSTFGVLFGLAGVEHGVGEFLQGPVRPTGMVIKSWGDAEGFEILGGEPALTVIPNLQTAGVVTVAVAVAFALWSAAFAHRRHGGLVLIGLAVVLFLVGGGFGPPLMGSILGIAATRIDAVSRRRAGRLTKGLARTWPWVLPLAVLAWLLLLPGTVLLDVLVGVRSAELVSALIVASFAGLLLALAAAGARDRARQIRRRTT